jgi:cell division protein ZapA
MSDSFVENKVVVKIFGEEYPITGATNSDHIVRIAEFVDARMREVAHTSRSKSREKIAILTALTLASELLEQRDQLKEFQSSQDSTVDDLLNRLNESLSIDS